jgi:hypothetical protein
MGARLAAVVLGVGLPCWAQGPAAAPPPAHRAASAAQSAADGVPQRGGEPVVLRIVSEDESVRVEELRVRGQTRRIVVRSKLPGVPAYEIGTAADGRDLTQDRRSEGRSLWQLLSF